MIKHNDITDDQVAYLLGLFADRREFFIATITLPIQLGTVPCGLYGPTMGDDAIEESEVTYAKRGTREWATRTMADVDGVPRPTRATNQVTVIAGPHDGAPCVLYTAFGGPSSPQEPGDPACKDVAASEMFWRCHALTK